MSLLHLATPEDTDSLLPLVAAFHGEMGYDTDTAHHMAAVKPLLNGSPHGAIWLVGPRRAPVGYVVISFGWSVEYGGLDGIVDEIYVRSAVRGRGIERHCQGFGCKRRARLASGSRPGRYARAEILYPRAVQPPRSYDVHVPRAVNAPALTLYGSHDPTNSLR